jgi:hypothetical protein
MDHTAPRQADTGPGGPGGADECHPAGPPDLRQREVDAFRAIGEDLEREAEAEIAKEQRAEAAAFMAEAGERRDTNPTEAHYLDESVNSLRRAAATIERSHRDLPALEEPAA